MRQRLVGLRSIPVATSILGLATQALVAAAQPSPPAHFDLLLIGDSITIGEETESGFRDDLHDLLARDPLHTFTFLGSAGDPPLQGHFRGGTQVEDFYPRSFGSGWGSGAFDTAPDLGPPLTPDIAAIHIGTNDLNTQAPPFGPYSFDHGKTLNPSHTAELAEFVHFLLQWRNESRSDHLQRIILSTIIPIGNRSQEVREWNDAVVAIAEDLAESTATGVPEQVTLADHYRRFMANPHLFTFGPGDWMFDALHPNAAGELEMARTYHRAILASIEDGVAPAAAQNLGVAAVDSASVTLSFLAGGDDVFLDRASHYDLRYSIEPFGAETFGLATQAVGEPEPGWPAAADTVVVTGLLEGTTYYFALKLVDDAGNRSPMSNTVTGTTAGEQAIVLQTQGLPAVVERDRF